MSLGLASTMRKGANAWVLAALIICMAVPMAQAFELPDALKKILHVVESDPWYERTYEAKLFRLPVKGKPIDFKYEALILLIAFAYLVVHRIGLARNRALAKRWLQAAMPLLEDEFAFVAKEAGPANHNWGVGEGNGSLIWNGGAEALAFASGRRGTDGLQILFSLAPVHDPIEWVYNYFYGIANASAAASSLDDVLSLTFLLPYASPDNVSGVFAIANKTNLRASRQGRYDLTFAKVLDGDSVNAQRQLDARFAIMSEVGELTDVLLGEVGERGNAQRQRVGLQSALNNFEESGKWLYSLVLSDQPERKPETGPIDVDKRKRALTLTMRVPRTEKEAKSSLALVEAACNLIDALDLGHARLSNATMNKLRQTRTQIDKDLKEEVTRYLKEEEEEAREAAKRKAEQEKFDKLSPAEQAKRKQVEKKRQQRKAQGKQAVKAR